MDLGYSPALGFEEGPGAGGRKLVLGDFPDFGGKMGGGFGRGEEAATFGRAAGEEDAFPFDRAGDALENSVAEDGGADEAAGRLLGSAGGMNAGSSSELS